MQKRSSSIVLLLVAFLFSSWSNVIAAGSCPRYLSNRDCCVKHVASQPKQVENKSCRHETAAIEMADMQMETDASSDSKSDSITHSSQVQPTFESSTDQVAFDLPFEQCAHCWSHSQPTSGSVSTVAVDPSKRLFGIDSPSADLTFSSPSAFPIFITPSEHGPPGTALPRHILINVFRI